MFFDINCVQSVFPCVGFATFNILEIGYCLWCVCDVLFHGDVLFYRGESHRNILDAELFALALCVIPTFRFCSCLLSTFSIQYSGRAATVVWRCVTVQTFMHFYIEIFIHTTLCSVDSGCVSA